MSSSVPQHEHQPKNPARDAPRVLIIGAGSRGRTYARCLAEDGTGIISAIAEPHNFKRQHFGKKYIWGDASSPPGGSCFNTWKDFITYEKGRRSAVVASPSSSHPPGIDAAFICVQDEHHREVVEALAPLGIHIMCEKPLATTLEDCLAVYKALRSGTVPTVFGIGHVLRYSPHNILLRRLLLEDKVIGDILSVVHTEPVGYWHFAHSYVRGNWRRTDTSAPSLLTKSCHDIDVLLWLLCSPTNPTSPLDSPESVPHFPSTVSSTGSLQYYRKSRKPAAAGDATNCLSCKMEPSCKFSAKKIYARGSGSSVAGGMRGWPVSIVLPEIEDFSDIKSAETAMMKRLEENYDRDETGDEEVKRRNWFGRCVYESDNDVCDEQIVTMTWEEDPLPAAGAWGARSGTETEASATGKTAEMVGGGLGRRGAKTATFHMISHTQKICNRYSHFYGTEGELEADSDTITVGNFSTSRVKKYYPEQEVGSGHGGGDLGLTHQFITAVDKVKNEGWKVDRAQREFVGCTLDEVIRSHSMVFAAEEARTGKKVVDWGEWWKRKVEEVV